ncbi:MAG TPA: hypothetical protein VGI87_04950 [Solirubrobacteraceae bacterium]|jgi:hypothetical protein
MARQFRRRLTFANVCSFTALVLALGTGGAYAANTIGSDDIIDESIQSVDIKNAQVKSADLAGSAVGSSKIGDGAVANSDVATGAIDSNSVLDESLTSSDLATDSVGATEIADASIDSGEIVDNSLFAADLAPNSVGSSEIATNAVGSSEVANESLTLSDIAGAATNGAISLSGIPNGRCSQVTFSVGSAQVGDSPIITTRAAIQDGILLYPNRVASAGHVEVNACNFTGSSMTAISNFPVRIITLR